MYVHVLYEMNGSLKHEYESLKCQTTGIGIHHGRITGAGRQRVWQCETTSLNNMFLSVYLFY